MHKKFNHLVAMIIITTSVLNMVDFTNATTQKSVLSKIVAFGDSYSDNGSANAISTAVVEPYMYFE